MHRQVESQHKRPTWAHVPGVPPQRAPHGPVLFAHAHTCPHRLTYTVQGGEEDMCRPGSTCVANYARFYRLTRR